MAPGFGQALPYLEKSCGVGTDLEGARAELSGAGVAVGASTARLEFRG